MSSKKTAKPAGKATGRDLQAFREAHDKSYIVPQKIRQGLAELGESWEYEMEFIRRCGLSQTDMGLYRDQFDGFFITAPSSAGNRSGKRVWCGTKAFANKLRGQIS